MQITRTTLLKRSNKSNILEAVLHNEVILLNPEKGKYYYMNETASLLWSWLDEPICLLSLRDKLSDKLGYYTPQAETEILLWLQHTLTDQLIEQVSPLNAQQTSTHSEKLKQMRAPRKNQNMGDYLSPKTSSFDVSSVTHGSSTDFQTDNLETGS